MSKIKHHEEWEVEAKDEKHKWIVSDTQLPTDSKERAQQLCEWWSEASPHISYIPVGYRVTRERIER